MVAHALLKTEIEYNDAVERTIELFDAQPGSVEFDELELLLVLVRDYEDKHYQMPEPSQIKSIETYDKNAGEKLVFKINSTSYEFEDEGDATTLTQMMKELTDKIKLFKIKTLS